MPNLKIKGPVKCLMCGHELKSLHGDDYSMTSDGIVSHLYAGYGSTLDGDVFQIALCDKCIEKLEKEDRIILKGNYIFGEVQNHRGEKVELEYD